MPDSLDNEALIQATSLKLNLNQFVVEKDFYLTKAIGALVAVQNDVFKLIFQGGTALAKAHHFIQRMSEDCDFRLAYRDPAKLYKKDVQRKLLRKFREQLIQALIDNGFKLENDAIKTRNQGQLLNYPVKF